MPELKVDKFRYEPCKFAAAELTPMESELVRPQRVKECPVQLEARVTALHRLNGGKLNELGGAGVFSA